MVFFACLVLVAHADDDVIFTEKFGVIQEFVLETMKLDDKGQIKGRNPVKLVVKTPAKEVIKLSAGDISQYNFNREPADAETIAKSWKKKPADKRWDCKIYLVRDKVFRISIREVDK